MILKIEYSDCIEFVPTSNIVRVEIETDDDGVWATFVLKELHCADDGNYKLHVFVGKKDEVKMEVLENIIERILTNTSSNVVDFNKLVEEKVKVKE